MPVRPPRVYIQRFNTTQVRVEAPATSRRARDGELFFDPETRTLRLGNGVAAGGVILAGPSGDVSSQLVAEEATFTLQANGDVVLEGTIRDAEGNDLLDIANTTPELPVASDTVLGGIKVGANLSIDEDGVLNAEDGNYTLPTAGSSVKGGVKLGEGFSVDGTDKVTTNKLYSTNLTQPTQHYRLTLDTNGVVHLPDESIINGATLRVVPGTGDLNYAALAAGPDSENPEKTWIWADANGASIETDSYDAAYIWHFDNDGNLNLPSGGRILTSSGDPLTADFEFTTDGSNRSTLYIGNNGANATMSLSTSGVEGAAYIEIPGDNAVGNGLNIYNGGANGRILAAATELVELRSDNNDVLLRAGNNWRFRQDGLMEFPDGSKQRTAAYPAGSAVFETLAYVDDYADPIAAGMTDLELEANEYDYDDERYYLSLPFNIKSFGRSINKITLSSNAFIAFETEVVTAGYIPQVGGTGIEDLIDAESVPLLCIFGRDSGWQKVYTKQLTSPNRFVVRFEGDPTHAGWGVTSTLKYNVVFYEDSDRIDLHIVANSGDPSLSFISDSWTNLGNFDNSQGQAYTIHTSPYLYDVESGDITMPAGGKIKAQINEDLYLSVTDAIDDGYELRLSVNSDTDETTRVAVSLDEVRIYTDLPNASNQWRFENNGQMRIPGPIWAYDANVVMYAMDTGSGLTYASLESRSNTDNDVFTTIKATPDGAVISTNLDNVAKTWTFNDAGKIVLPGSNVIGTGTVPAVSSNTTSITDYAYDATGTTVTLTSGDTVDFPNFSGSILVNSYNGGGVTQYLCGGGAGNATAIGSSKVTPVGTMSDNSGIGGYTFTATETGEHCFYVIRTRTGA